MLQEQDHVYVRPQAMTREAFVQYWPLRQRWLPRAAGAQPAAAAVAATANIRVCARFRPLQLPQPAEPGGDGDANNDKENEAGDAGAAAEADTVEAAVVPLHQRLHLLKRQYQCSTQEALRRLWGGTVDG